MPFEQNIEQRHLEKANKYAHFETDCTNYNCRVTAFEVGSCGYISTRNQSAIYTLHKFTKPGSKTLKIQEKHFIISPVFLISHFHYKK